MEENKKKIKFKIIGFIFIGITLIITYGFVFGIKGLKIKEYNVIDKNLPISFYGLKVVHFSDLHYGRIVKEKNLIKIIEEINNLEGDIVIFTGDLIDRDTKINSTIKNVLIDNLSKIKSTYGNYFVGGNHDLVKKDFYEIMETSNFNNLENNNDIIYKDDDSIYLTGIPSSVEKNITFNLNKDLPKYKILLMHEPDNMKYISKYNMNLVLAGHSHNGQVRLPIIGKIITPKGAKIYYDEYYKVNNTNFYISSGLGTSVLDIRLFNKPSINLYRLVNK
ncbi:MAG: metallophosphoesterase [Bacilli bacterium]|nr:metallophosphoesterase [Bacilli bacterium]